MQKISYEVIAKSVVERIGGETQYALKLLYRGDGSPYWTVTSGLDLVCNEAVFQAATVGSFLMIELTVMPPK